ncbi:centrobin isoform X2 [Hoplias malabaricus]
MSMETTEVVLSDVEPLPISSPPSPSLSHPSVPLSSSFPSFTRSWPSSPLSSSRQVTARLYSSLQRSRQQEGLHSTCLTDRPHRDRQVSFNPSSLELGSVAMMAASNSLSSERLRESQQVEFGLDDVTSGAEEVESEAEILTEEMDLNLQSSVNNSAKLSSGRQHIEEMENVRSHLQTLLRSAPPADSADLIRPSQHLQDESYQSDTTSHLLSASLSLGGVEELFPRYSRLHGDVNPAPLASFSELQVIRESLERERTRRKNAEQQVLVLQSKLLALQQQLALAVSADRKKDVMIEQLDKTLEKVVEGWRGQEREKSERVKRLQEEKEAAESARDKHREALVCFEKSLSEAAETLQKEQKHNEELHNVNTQQERELEQLRVCVEKLRSEAEDQRAKVENLQEHTHTLQTQLEQQHQQHQHTHTQLQTENTHLTQQLERERERVGLEVQLREEAQSTIKQLQQELEETRRERDTARVDRALDQARFEAQRSQWEVELRLRVEQEVTERLGVIQQENNTTTAKLREQHRKQLLDLSARHERELSCQMEEFREQLEEKEEKQQQLSLHFNSRIAALQEELVSMETCRRRLEMQREELVSRLQGMMRSHWTEALRLLSSQDQADGMLSPLSIWDGSKAHSSQDPDSSIYSTANTHASAAAAQAVVLHLSRERERGMRGERETRGEEDMGVLNHSHAFSPLEPVLDDTNLTAVGGSDGSQCWDRPLGGGEKEREGERGRAGKMVVRGMAREKERTEREVEMERIVRARAGEVGRRERERTALGREGERERMEGIEVGLMVRIPEDHQSQTLNQTSGTNQIRSQIGPSVNRQMNLNLNQSLRPNQGRASPERLTSQSQSLEKGAGQHSRPVEKYSSAGMKAPPTTEQSLSVRARAPPTETGVSPLGEERQSELQYYISKLLDRSPGDILEDQDQCKTGTHCSDSGLISQWDSLQRHTPAPSKPVNTPSSPSTHTQREANTQLEHLAELLHLAFRQTHNNQQLIDRPDEPCPDPVGTSQNRNLPQNDGRVRQPSSRSSRGRRNGPQAQRTVSKVNIWR